MKVQGISRQFTAHTWARYGHKPCASSLGACTQFEHGWEIFPSRLLSLQYLQQLAIITPYAQLELEYTCHANPKKDLTAVYRRRSEQMPPVAYEVKHHPGSVNNLLIQQLIHRQVIIATPASVSNAQCSSNGAHTYKVNPTVLPCSNGRSASRRYVVPLPSSTSCITAHPSSSWLVGKVVAQLRQ